MLYHRYNKQAPHVFFLPIILILEQAFFGRKYTVIHSPIDHNDNRMLQPKYIIYTQLHIQCKDSCYMW